MQHGDDLFIRWQFLKNSQRGLCDFVHKMSNTVKARVVIGIMLAFLIGWFVGLYYQPYVITSAPYNRTFKLQRWTGQTWIYSGGEWIAVRNR